MKKINLTTTSPQLSLVFKELSDYFELASDEGYQIIFRPIEQKKTHIEEKGNTLTIWAPSIPKMLHSLFLYLNDQRSLMTFTHSFEKNGLMIDHSRNAVMNIPTVKKTIREMAVLGHTWLFMYMEDVYELPGYPYFGAYRGRYTQEELKELDRYAQQLGVEVIPCIQTLAHLNQYFWWEHISQEYADIDDILNINQPNTKVLIEAMIETLRKTFTTKYIHLGMDEAYNLGRGAYLDQNGLKAKPAIMKEHLTYLKAVCRDHGFEPMIWDDMFFSGYSNIQEDASYTLPEDIALVYWDYYNTRVEHYHERFKQRKDLSKDVIFAGGAWRWFGYTPHHQKTLMTTKAALASAKAHQIQRVFTTAWGDDGSEAPFDPMRFGLVLFAYLDHNEHYDENQFNEWLIVFTQLSYKEWMLQGALDLLPHLELTDAVLDLNPSKYFLYQDLFSPLFQEQIDAVGIDYGKYMLELTKAFKALDKGSVLVHQFYEEYTQLLEVKWNLPKLIYEAYKQKDHSQLRHIVDESLPRLVEHLNKTLQARRQVWLDECKPQGLEILEHRFGGMIQRTWAVQSRLLSYLNGEVATIPELEEERLDALPKKPKGPHGIVEYNRALRIMSRNRMTW